MPWRNYPKAVIYQFTGWYGPVRDAVAVDVPNRRRCHRHGGLGHVPSPGLRPILDPCRAALLVRCGLNRRPPVSRPLSRRGAADPASLREGKLSACASRDLLARKPALLVLPDRTCEAARPLPVLVNRIEGQTGKGRNRFGSQRRNRHGQAL